MIYYLLFIIRWVYKRTFFGDIRLKSKSARKEGKNIKKEMEYLGIDLSCAMGSLRNGEFPEKDCLLPLISKLLGYILVAASITVKLPQVYQIS